MTFPIAYIPYILENKTKNTIIRSLMTILSKRCAIVRTVLSLKYLFIAS